MKLKKVFQLILATALLLLSAFSAGPAFASEADTKIGYVSVSSGSLNVRTGPGINHKIIGTLQNNASVTVYAQSKSGWSKIGHNKRKAYVASKYLRMYSYLPDKNKLYTYETLGEAYTARYIGQYKQEWDTWTRGEHFTIIKENSEGLFKGTPEADYFFILVYPLAAGKQWTDWEVNYKITGLNGTLTTRAGTFKHVVTVTNSENFTYYYAQNTGLIKAVHEGKTETELVRITNK